MFKLNKEKIDNLFSYTMIFLIGCFIGCVFESFLCFIQRGYFESRKGLIYGPFNPVYGLGAVVLIWALKKYKKDSSIFFIGALTGGIVEYGCSWIQEFLFHTTSWNYSKYFLNFDGRTSVYHMLWWGLLSLLFMRHVYPKFVKSIDKIKNHRLLITIIILSFFIIDGFISGYANYRQYERSVGIKATTNLQKFFDKHYPDELVNKVYPNRRDAETKEKINEKSPKGNVKDHHNRKTDKSEQGH